MQHYVFTGSAGGPVTGLRKLMNSQLSERYRFVPLHQDRAANGINVGLFLDLVNEIRRAKPDILHVRGLQSEGLYGVLAGRVAGCRRIVLSVHGFYGDVILLGTIKRFLFNYLVEPLTLWSADAVYCVCEAASRRRMIKTFARNFKGVIPNVAPSIFPHHNSDFREKIRHGLDIAGTDVVAVTVSRITIDKGFQEYAKVVKRVVRLRRNIRFLVIGTGSYFEEFKKELGWEITEGRVIVLGQRDNVLDYLIASDLFVFPTLHENLSNALLESAVAGLPAVATAVGGNPEVVVHGITGILVPPYDHNAMVEAILNLTDQDRRRSLGQAAKQRVLERYSAQRVYSRLDEVYQYVLHKR